MARKTKTNDQTPVAEPTEPTTPVAAAPAAPEPAAAKPTTLRRARVWPTIPREEPAPEPEAANYEMPSEDEGEPVAAEPVAAAAPVAVAKYKTFTRELAGEGELLTHAQELERRQIELEAELKALRGEAPAAVVTPASVAAPVSSKFDAERFFTDPVGAVAELKAEIKREMGEDSAAKSTRVEFWTSFYNAHPDLRGCEDIVDLTVAKAAGAWDNIELAKVKVLLATEARARVAKIRTLGTSTETISSTTATTASSSGAAAARGPAKVAPKTFAQQLAAMRSRGRATIN